MQNPHNLKVSDYLAIGTLTLECSECGTVTDVARLVRDARHSPNAAASYMARCQFCMGA